jgi:hypothetical protein
MPRSSVGTTEVTQLPWATSEVMRRSKPCERVPQGREALASIGSRSDPADPAQLSRSYRVAAWLRCTTGFMDPSKGT